MVIISHFRLFLIIFAIFQIAKRKKTLEQIVNLFEIYPNPLAKVKKVCYNKCELMFDFNFPR